MRGEGPSSGIILLIILLALVPFLPALENGLVWDDHLLVEKNPALREPGRAFFKMTRMGSHYTPYYRPLMTVTLSLERTAWGLHPLGYHLTNLILHTLVSASLLLILWRLLTPWPAGLSAGVFAVHPVHVEPVSFVAAGRSELLPAFLFLAALALLLPAGSPDRSPSRPGRNRLWAAAGVFFLSLLSKEVAVVFPLFVVIVWWRGRSATGRPWRQIAAWLSPFLVFLAVYGALRWYAASQTGATAARGTLVAQAGQYPTLILEIFRLLFFPYTLNPYYEIPPAARSEIILCGAVLVLFAAGLFRLGRERRWDLTFFLGAALLVAPLIPALPFLPRGGALLAERFLYLPSAGFVILVGGALEVCSRKMPAGAFRKMAGVLSVIIIVMGYWAMVRSGDWRSDAVLFARGLQRDPRNATLHFLRGGELFRTEKYHEAEEELRRSLSLHPTFIEAQVKLAELYRVTGRHGEAREIYSRVLASHPESAAARFGIGSLEMDYGKRDRAVDELTRAVELDPFLTGAYTNLGVIAYEAGDLQSAKRQWEAGLAAEPGNPLLLNNLGVIAKRQGRFEEARRYYQQALRHDPHYRAARRNLEWLPQPEIPPPP